jgi:putative mRNA 3-end processing factor
MQVRGNRRRRGVDRGFALSDHADWPDLLRAIEATGATRVLVTHGRAAPLVRFLGERGLDARPLAVEYGEDDVEDAALAEAAPPAAAPAPQ